MSPLKNIPPLITSQTARKIFEGSKKVSLDLGLSEVDIEFEKNKVKLPNDNILSLDELKKVLKRKNAVYFVGEERLYQVAISSNRFFKLVPTLGAPTLEIDGIRMHRTRDTTPDIDAQKKIRALDIKQGKVLDTCTGLGYTVIKALEKNCETIISVELQPEVLEIASINPWSKKLFMDLRVHLMIGDTFDIVNILPSSFFNYIIHDPPRFSHAGQLYSRQFYSRLFRILRDGGKMFHYTGQPGSKYRRVDFRRGVIKRLRLSGFKEIVYFPNIRGVICKK